MLQRGMRTAARLAIAGGITAAMIGGSLALTVGVASASGGCGGTPADGNVYIACALLSASTPYAHFTDGQAVDLSMGTNSTFNGSGVGANLEAIECEYNDGTGGAGDPPSAAFCDAQTLPADMPYSVNADGSFDYVADNNGDRANMYSVPGTNFHGATIRCDSSHPCVWYVGENYNNFSAPHVFSNPFLVGTAPSITSHNSTAFVAGVSRSFQMTTTGDPTTSTFSETGALPSGVTLSPSGLLSGTPPIGPGASFPITAFANNGFGSPASQNFALNVAGVVITTQQSDIPTATIGVSYSATITAAGGTTPYKWKGGKPLPKGLKFKKGMITGTPKTKDAPGTYGPFIIEVFTHKTKTLPAVEATASFTMTLVS